MKTKTDAEVIIGGKRYSLSGYESEEYLQKIASYINGKEAELKAMEGYRRFDNDTKIVLTQINLADDYFKLKSQMSDVASERDVQSTELFNIKHDIIEIKKKYDDLKQKANEKIDKLSSELSATKDALTEEQKKVIRYEAEEKSLKAALEEEQKKTAKLEQELNMYKKRR